jgi:carbonic anhydrase
MKRTLALISGLSIILTAAVLVQGKDAPPPSAASVLADLKAGNERYVSGHPLHPHQTVARRQELASGQEPRAIILACADSRVGPEIVFDQGLGDIFVVRVAGNIADPDDIASIEYAAEHLHAPLLVVVGHEKCGAVAAAAAGGEAPGHLGVLVKAILPAVEKARGEPGDLVENAVRINVENVVAQLRSSEPILAHLVKEGKLQVTGAVYSLDTGKVAWLP